MVDKFLEELKRHLKGLNNALDKEINPISWIRLDAQCMLTVDMIKLYESMLEEEKRKNKS